MNCVFCSNELQWENGHPKCDCGGNYFIAPQGSSEVKIACPCCSRNILLDNSTYGHKIACSCDTYLAVIEAPASILSSSEPPLHLDLLNDTENQSEVIVKNPVPTPKTQSKTKPNFGKKKRKLRQTTETKRKLRQTTAIKRDRNKTSSKQGSPSKKKKKSIVFISAIVTISLIAGYFLYSPLLGEKGVFANFANTDAEDNNHPRQDSNGVHLNPDILNSFLSSHCTECHGTDKQKGDIRLDTLTLAISNSDTAQHWQEVLDALNLGEMPPEDEPQPSKEELETIIEHLTIALQTSKKRLSEDGGNIALRRINRREYRHSIEQLLGMHISESILPADAITEGYDTVGQDQHFSSHHFDDYFETAKSVATVALKWVDKEKPAPKSRTYPAEGQHKHMYKKFKSLSAYVTMAKARGGYIDRRKKNMHTALENYIKVPYNDKGVFVLEGSHYGSHPGDNFLVDPRASYKLTVKAGLVAESPAIRHFLKVTIGPRILGYLNVSGSLESPQETQTLEYQAQFFESPYARFGLSENKAGAPIKKYLEQIGDKTGKAAIWLDEMTIKGPFYKQASAIESIYKQTIATVDANKGDQELDLQAKQFLKEFMNKAFRGRDPAPEYEQLVLKIYSLDRKQGKELKESLITPLAMILSSPSFLYLMEDAPATKEGVVNEVEFANRISHFLWSRSASDELLADAKAGKLKDKAVLKKHINWMLKQKNSFALSEGFFDQWVDMERFESIGIDENSHVKFNKGVQHSAKLEVQHFFHTLLKENLSLTQLIDSDFVVINDLLALHYGLNAPNKGNEFHKVKLPADSPRGGLLGTVAFLSMGSNGERSSPIIRGALIQEKFFNRKPPQPPPNVPELEDVSDKVLSVRESIALHRQQAQCASCHRSFDPLGYGLENFDLIGLWRDQEIIENMSEENKKITSVPIKAEGVFPNKEPFHNLDEFRTGLMAHKHLLTRSITEGLLSYGLGRHIEFADQQALDEICEKASQNNEQIGDIIYSIISHPLFRRADQASATASSKMRISKL
ncbi:DUF1592 domain-containing protein [Lentisphaera profundi]|uniref:DUF1592 domain-containing protein n=1 Tax=Lentisphaera profundi TaxID=1658616 RepID=A0ABY7W0C3_9BACT|nr:DUF1588 domain-containing protein [Lentisphaera profundi]WDE98948.1 DUF1592 domain-containing protein [Lentisphaera profundi]